MMDMRERVSYRQLQPAKVSLQRYIMRHMQAALSSLGRLCYAPISSLLTASAIGIALALPAAMLLMVFTSQSLTKDWQMSNQISLFFDVSASEKEVRQAQQKLLLNADIISAKIITPQMGLQELQAQLGLAQLETFLPDNPLPPVIVLTPAQHIQTPALINTLREGIKLPKLIESQLDMGWVAKWHQIMDLAKRMGLSLFVLMGLSVMLIIGNTIRLSIQTHLKEIQVMKLFGASPGFMRRPFLYMGFYYGAFGAILSGILLAAVYWSLHRPLFALLKSYDVAFHITGLSFSSLLGLLLCGALMGWLGAWLSVTRQLKSVACI